MESPEPPPGYRRLQPEDLAIGKDVLYIGRSDPSTLIKTHIVEETTHGDIKLEVKPSADTERVFIIVAAAGAAASTSCRSFSASWTAAAPPLCSVRTGMSGADSLLLILRRKTSPTTIAHRVRRRRTH